jgi:hypothetical protein
LAILSIDLRSGRANARLRALAAGWMEPLSKLAGEPREQVVLVIHEGGDHAVAAFGEHRPGVPGVRSDV